VSGDKVLHHGKLSGAGNAKAYSFWEDWEEIGKI